MKILNRALIGVLALLACASVTSCKKGTYLELVFKGATLPTVRRIAVSLTLPDGTVASDRLPEDAAVTNVVELPASAAFQLDDHTGTLAISATALDPADNVLAKVDTTTTIMHGQTWTVVIDFSAPAGSDAGVDASPADAGDDASLVTITDGSIDSGGCVSASVQASESVSLDYNSSGSDMDSGNMLWAYVGQAEQTVGWMKFGVRFVPKTAHLTKATLNLFYSQSSGSVPMLTVAYSTIDGWTRKSKASDVSNDGVISTGAYLTPNAAPASTPYTLDVTTHNWMLDFTDGNVTLGIQNMPITSSVLTSRVEFYGVNHSASPDATRPTLDLEFCP